MAKETVELKKIINMNMPIIVRILTGVYEGTYGSRIEDINNSEIMIAVPTDRHGVPVPILKDTKIEVDFILEEKGRFRFKSKVLGRTTGTKLPFLMIDYPSDATREQLREFFRVPVRIETKLYKFYEDVPDVNMKIPFKSYDAVIVDISGGGGKLKTTLLMELKERFSLDMSEFAENLSRVECEVVRSHVINEDEKYEVCFQFDLDKEADRNKIIKYVFKRQIELREMGVF